MENEDTETFNRKMFTCAICKNLLKAPVMIVEDIGDVCNHCFESRSREEDLNGLPNTKLDVILKSLKFPCKFESKGCNVTELYEKLKDHECQCVYRTFSCLMRKEDCDWRGMFVELYDHFKDAHSKHVLNSPYSRFSFELNVTRFADIRKLLCYKSRIFILKIKSVGEDNSLLHSLQEVTPTTEEYSDWIVKYVGKSSQYRTQIKPSSLSTCDNQHRMKIKLSTLQDVLESEDSLNVVIKPKVAESRTVTAEVRNQLECPVCTELMRPPIILCTSGHSFCNTCQKKQNECGICRQNWSGDDDDDPARNLALETVTLSVQYSCVYQTSGCLESFLGNEITKHESVCQYKTYTCPISSCNFTADYSSCKNHFINSHKTFLVQETVYKDSFKCLKSSVNNIKYFFQHGNIYELTFTRLAEYCTWDVKIMNSYDEDIKYFCIITITDQHMKENQIARSLGLVKNSSKNFFFKYDYLKQFGNASNGGIISYCCEFFRQQSD